MLFEKLHKINEVVGGKNLAGLKIWKRKKMFE